MKPAPPVTSSLGTGDLFQDSAQALAPMSGSDAVAGERALVENAVGRPPGRCRIVRRAYRCDRDVARNQPELRAFLRNRHREVVPAGDSRVRPMVDATNLRIACDSPERLR